MYITGVDPEQSSFFANHIVPKSQTSNIGYILMISICIKLRVCSLSFSFFNKKNGFIYLCDFLKEHLKSHLFFSYWEYESSPIQYWAYPSIFLLFHTGPSLWQGSLQAIRKVQDVEQEQLTLLGSVFIFLLIGPGIQAWGALWVKHRHL